MRNLADSGYIPAISFVIGDYKEMGVDPDFYLSILQDLNDDSGEYYIELAQAYRKTGKVEAASAAIEKSLGRGCLNHLYLCKDWKRVTELLEGLNPADYTIEEVSLVASEYILLEDIHNKWMDYSLECIERDLSKGELHISQTSLLRETRCESYSVRLRHICESILELAKEHDVERDNYLTLYIISKGLNDDENQRFWGLRSLENGSDRYLDNASTLRRFIDGDGNIIDRNFFEDLVSASSEIRVYNAIALQYEMDIDIRVKYAEKSIDLGSEEAKLILACIKLNEIKYPDYSSILELVLSAKIDDYLLKRKKNGLILDCYEALHGEDPNDPIALGLYRMLYSRKHSIKNKHDENMRRILSMIEGELIKNE